MASRITTTVEDFPVKFSLAGNDLEFSSASDYVDTDDPTIIASATSNFFLNVEPLNAPAEEEEEVENEITSFFNEEDEGVDSF